MTIDTAWKERIVAASALDAVKVPHAERVMPPFTLPQTGVPFAPRALRTPLIDLLESDPASVDPAQVGPQLLAAVRAGGGHELLPFAGQSAQLVHDIAPAAELVARLVAASLDALRQRQPTRQFGVTGGELPFTGRAGGVGRTSPGEDRTWGDVRPACVGSSPVGRRSLLWWRWAAPGRRRRRRRR